MKFKFKAYYMLIGFFCFFGQSVNAQDNRVGDSLLDVYLEDTLSGDARLELLKNLSFNAVDDYNLALKYADELIDLAKRDENEAYLAHGYIRKGNAEKLMGNLEEALNAFFLTAEIAKKKV